MEHPVTAVYDANILYPAPLRDLFMRASPRQDLSVRAGLKRSMTNGLAMSSRTIRKLLPSGLHAPEP